MWQKSAPWDWRKMRRKWRPVVYSHTLFTLVIMPLSQGHLVLQHHFRVWEWCGAVYNLTCTEQRHNWGTAVISLSPICWERTSAPVHGLYGPVLADGKKTASVNISHNSLWPFTKCLKSPYLPSLIFTFLEAAKLSKTCKEQNNGAPAHHRHTHWVTWGRDKTAGRSTNKLLKKARGWQNFWRRILFIYFLLYYLY